MVRLYYILDTVENIIFNLNSEKNKYKLLVLQCRVYLTTQHVIGCSKNNIIWLHSMHSWKIKHTFKYCTKLSLIQIDIFFEKIKIKINIPNRYTQKKKCLVNVNNYQMKCILLSFNMTVFFFYIFVLWFFSVTIFYLDMPRLDLKLLTNFSKLIVYLWYFFMIIWNI